MAFITLPDFKGKIFIPDEVESNKKKHNCNDCYFCQMCSDERCDLCLKKKCKQRDKDKV